MNRKQRRIGVKPTSTARLKHRVRASKVTIDQANDALIKLLNLYEDKTPKEEAIKILNSTGKFTLKDGGVTFRMVPVEEGLKQIDDILANGGTIEYPE